MRNNFSLYDTILPRVEAIAWPIAILGLAAKWQLMSAGSSLLVIGLLNLSVVYFLRSFSPPKITNEFTEIPPFVANSSNPYLPATGSTSNFFIDNVVPKLTGISSAVALIGVMFKLLNLPGSNELLVVGTATLVTVVLLLALKQRMDERALVIGALSACLLFTPSEILVRHFHRDDPAFAEKLIHQLRNPYDPAANEAVRQHLAQKRAVH